MECVRGDTHGKSIISQINDIKSYFTSGKTQSDYSLFPPRQNCIDRNSSYISPCKIKHKEHKYKSGSLHTRKASHQICGHE